MKKLNLLAISIVLFACLSGCSKDEGDIEKIVELKIHAETGYGASVLSDVLTQPLLFTDNDDHQMRLMVDVIFENFDLDYERGYEYILKAKKIWMKEPPQDVSSIKYVVDGLIAKTKVITENSEENLDLFVSPETVKFTPRYPNVYEEINGTETLKIFDALHVKKVGTNNWMALVDIEGFDYEKGFSYTLKVKKVTQADPYSVRYVLTEIVSKTKN